MKKPNILFIFSDQQRWDTLGCYGQSLDISPNLDRIAGEGVRFEQAITCQPVCGPARACLQTGKYATEMGTFRNGIPLPLHERTLAHELRDAGYSAGYIGKWHLASERFNVDQQPSVHNYENSPVPPERRGGYADYWLASDVLEFTSHSYDGHMFNGEMEQVDFPPDRYRVDVLTDWVIDYLRALPGDKPFFLFVSYIEPHHQNDHNRYEGPRGSKERFKDYEIPGDLVGTEGDWRENFPDYLGCCHSLDENVGRIDAVLDELGLAQDTLLIYTSDHGSHFRTRNSEYKRAPHEGCVRVPLIIRGPGFTGGKVVENLVSLIDLPPTVVSAGGVAPAEHMHGRQLQDLVEGPPTDWLDEVFIQISESQVGRALRTNRWKYSVYAPDKQGGRDMDSDRYVEQYLYDLHQDPYEKHNLVSDPAYSDIRTKLAQSLSRRMVEAGEQAPEISPIHRAF
ncbi:MAG: sulfatase-like hydrolase/transferase [Anaerolineae bacterium]|nr:sulfatase-like hydrolase/transferase [Anaerolineae bacterium]